MAAQVVCRVEELPAGQRKIVDIKGRSVGVFNIEGTYYAVRNTCPHQGAALCTAGTVGGTMLPSAPHEYVFGMENRVLRCPWHAWEFDLATGKSLFDPEGTRVRTYAVWSQDGYVVIDAEQRPGGDGV